jgi:hypothetical protein
LIHAISRPSGDQAGCVLFPAPTALICRRWLPFASEVKMQLP